VPVSSMRLATAATSLRGANVPPVYVMLGVSKFGCGAMIGNCSIFKWVTRALVYSVLGFILFVFARNRSEQALTEHLWECEIAMPARSSSYLDSGDWRKQRAIRTIQCMKDRSGFVTTLFLSETKAMSFLAPATPCKYIGKWRSIRPDGEYDVELARDGQFNAEPAPGGPALRPIASPVQPDSGR
jgi:hypothetical protein